MRFIHLASSIAAAVLVGAASPVLAENAANAEKDSPISNQQSGTYDSRDNRGR
jgi:hypothetical protein